MGELVRREITYRHTETQARIRETSKQIAGLLTAARGPASLSEIQASRFGTNIVAWLVEQSLLDIEGMGEYAEHNPAWKKGAEQYIDIAVSDGNLGLDSILRVLDRAAKGEYAPMKSFLTEWGLQRRKSAYEQTYIDENARQFEFSNADTLLRISYAIQESGPQAEVPKDATLTYELFSGQGVK